MTKSEAEKKKCPFNLELFCEPDKCMAWLEHFRATENDSLPKRFNPSLGHCAMVEPNQKIMFGLSDFES